MATQVTNHTKFLMHLLTYLETPPHLRKHVFPIHPDLRTVGSLPSLDMPHHLRAYEWCQYREGVTIAANAQQASNGGAHLEEKGRKSKKRKTSLDTSLASILVDASFSHKITVPRSIPLNTRLTLKSPSASAPADPQSFEAIAEAVAPSTPREEACYYWGYIVRSTSSLSNIFTESPYDGGYDVTVGTSERGSPLSSLTSSTSAVPEFRHMLVDFGGVAGLEVAVKADVELASVGVAKPEELFDFWINLVEGQGSRTIRTEEAVWLASASFGTVTRLVDLFLADDVHGVAKAFYFIYGIVMLHPASGGQMSSSAFNIEDEIGDYPSPRAGNEDGTSDPEKAQTRRTKPARPPLVTGPSSRRVSRIQSITRKSSWAARFTHALSHVKSTKEFIVDFEGPDDPYHPRNWPFRKKVVTTLLYSFTTAGITLASSIYSPAINELSHEFHVGTEVTLLGLSLMMIGFSLGPLIWAPLSEIYGRKAVVLIPFFVSAIFAFETATAKDIQTVILTRFFAGLFGSAPVTNTGGVLGDIWHPTQRGTAMVGYTFGVMGGTMVGPVVGGAIIQSSLGWRWTEYITGIFQMAVLVLDVLILDESYPPRLLVYKARRLRITTGNWTLHARFEEWDVTLKEMMHKFGVRPFQMLLTPICFSLSIYVAFCYGLLYAALMAFPIAFQEGRGWNPLVGALPFLAILIGFMLGGGVNVANNRYYNRRFAANGDRPVPEARLPPMMLGSVFLAAGLFIFGWTAPEAQPWVAPCVGAAVLGLGFFTIFQSALNYLIDTFQRYSASAVAATTFLRSLFAAVLPLFICPMYHEMGVGWATSVFGFCAVAMMPVPFLFWWYGERIRGAGRFSANVR
ncbi:MAG: mfs multidrug [Lasallia pustulata]|uniref:Mfs multidrug n=1 Tax=Lasallia pustulata TaxID=136370 RepID=A0A5M8PUR1_9LECA|nr:MAG: mfs multidrug [Lasallia pustulata]